MATTINFLRSGDSLARFPSGSTIDHNAQYLNNDGNPRYRWTAENATLTAVANIVKIPSCNSLLILPSSTGDVFVRLNGTKVDGTVKLERNPVEYLFHCLLLSSKPAAVLTRLESAIVSESPKGQTLSRDLFTVCRSNRLILDPDAQLPGASYLGSDPLVNIEIQISGHEGSPIYMTFPALIDANAWKFNSFVTNSARYIPTVYRDIDETQDPEFPFFKLVDALTHGMGEAAQLYADWFRFEPDELPSSALETDQWVRSQLTDARIAPEENLRWLANFSGRHLIDETYAVDASSLDTVGWQSSSYPLDMNGLIVIDVASMENLSLDSDLIARSFFSPVKTTTTANVNLSSELINGAVFSGYTVSTGDRVLVRHQSNPAENGIYIVAASGAASRSADANDSMLFITWRTVLVEYGFFAGTSWRINTTSAITLGTTPVIFVQTSSGYIDGINIVDGQTVLLLNQDDPRENGIYVTSTSYPSVFYGDPINTVVRLSSLNTSSEFVDGLHFEVAAGDSFAGSLWRLFVDGTFELDVDPVRIFYVDRKLDFYRSQVHTAMYGHAAGNSSSIASAAKRFLTGTRSVAIGPNSPSQYFITVKTLTSETPNIDPQPSWTTVSAATTENINISTALNSGDTIDGVVLGSSTRVLVKNQSTASENGIYISGAVPARATDANTVGEFTVGKTVYVTNGTVNDDSYFALTTAPATLGVSDILFERAQTLGSSETIISALEPTRPIGYQFIHQTVNRFSFTFNSPSLGRLDQGTLS